MNNLVSFAVVLATLLVAVNPSAAQRGGFRPGPIPPPYPYPYPYPYFFPFPIFENNYQYGGPNYYRPQPTTDALPAPKENRAVIKIVLPSTANDIWVDGVRMPTRETSSRVFISPPLEPGHNYTYVVRAAWATGQGMLGGERSVVVGANRTAIVDFNQPPSQ